MFIQPTLKAVYNANIGKCPSCRFNKLFNKLFERPPHVRALGTMKMRSVWMRMRVWLFGLTMWMTPSSGTLKNDRSYQLWLTHLNSMSDWEQAKMKLCCWQVLYLAKDFLWSKRRSNTADDRHHLLGQSVCLWTLWSALLMNVFIKVLYRSNFCYSNNSNRVRNLL